VTIRELSPRVRVIGVAGVEDVSAIGNAGGSDSTGGISAGSGVDWIALAGRHLAIVADAGAPALADALERRAIRRVDPLAWAWLDITSGFPWVVDRTQEAFTPQMLNLDRVGSVSFEKGCYPGQEIVARTHYRGQPSRRMYRAAVDADEAPLAGTEVFGRELGDQASGRIVAAAPGPGSGWEVLAVLHAGAARPGAAALGAPGGPPLRLLPLPYALE
jgi:folate-binding protein YgfZ